MNKVEVIKCNDDINKMYDVLKARYLIGIICFLN